MGTLIFPLLTEEINPGKEGKTASTQTRIARGLRPDVEDRRSSGSAHKKMDALRRTVPEPVDRRGVGRVDVGETDATMADEKVVRDHDSR